ncbi:hypothetical protein EGW08_017876 [Elysia chlorotica]|uniref:Kazal-like domain-containing protein n=1 Tax=Elysia chlorotica TaxID=188477 RepID=A0A433SYL2_ELYCH|nr:hypothetical protein EGW08_017876 [Elysia chlorotica]
MGIKTELFPISQSLSLFHRVLFDTRKENLRQINPSKMASLFTTGFVLLVVYCGSSLSLACDPAAQSDTECSGSEEEPVPVCATFTKNFASACALEAELCRLAKDGFHHVEKRDGDCCLGRIAV